MDAFGIVIQAARKRLFPNREYGSGKRNSTETSFEIDKLSRISWIWDGESRLSGSARRRTRIRFRVALVKYLIWNRRKGVSYDCRILTSVRNAEPALDVGQFLVSVYRVFGEIRSTDSLVRVARSPQPSRCTSAGVDLELTPKNMYYSSHSDNCNASVSAGERTCTACRADSANPSYHRKGAVTVGRVRAGIPRARMSRQGSMGCGSATHGCSRARSDQVRPNRRTKRKP